MSKTDITEDEALRHHDGWSAETRSIVRSELVRVGAIRFRTNVHGYWNSVQVFDAAGTLVADIMKTRVRYPPEFAPSNAEATAAADGFLFLPLDGVERRSGHRSALSGSKLAEPKTCSNPDCAQVYQRHPGECW